MAGHQGGESESIIGEWLRQSGKRAQVLIATKVGSDMGGGNNGLAKSYIVRAVEESLQRLQTDYIDLYQSHIDDQSAPLEETLSAYAQLVQQGKVRAIGASNYTADRLSQALNCSRGLGSPRYESLQPLYNLYDRSDFEGPLEQVCRENQLGVIPYFPLASGFLTGKYRSAADAAGKARGQFVSKYLNDRGFQVLQALDTVSERHQAKPVQVALAWLIAHPTVTAPIASATSLAQLEDLTAAATLRLDKDSMQELERASA